LVRGQAGAKEVKGWKAELRRQIAREHKRAAREKLLSLRGEVRHAREKRKLALSQARERCKHDRVALRVKLKAKRAALMQKISAIAARQRKLAHETCSGSIAQARAIKNEVQRARAELAAERQYRRELRAIAQANRQALAEHKATARVRRDESDDEVMQNIPADYVSLWKRVRKGIKGSPRMSRTEAFMQYAEENPHELLETLDDVTDRMVRELERKERAAAQHARSGPSKAAYATPF
jgi:hypothetical protein